MRFEIKENTLTKYLPDAGDETVAVPDGVVTIGCGAFSGVDQAISVILPDSVTCIDDFFGTL